MFSKNLHFDMLYIDTNLKKKKQKNTSTILG